MPGAAKAIAGNTADEAAILALMKAETDAFLSRDFEALRRNWIDAPQSRFLITWPGVGARVYCGIDEIATMLSDSVTAAPPVADVANSVDRVNVSIVVLGDMAWASYDQVSRRDDPDLIINGVQHELKIFHRVGADWKIACVVVLAQTVEHIPDPLVAVTQDLTVTWENGPGRALLREHPGLIVSASRLRARDRRFDAGLREAVAAAHDGMSTNPRKSSGGADKTRAVPLGEDDAGAPIFCWVFVEDGKLLIGFDEAKAGPADLERARGVFGLSPTQMRLARLLIQGHELAGAAQSLGVSINTARTQLNRMFDKTGVHSQAALVRRLITLRVPTKA
jgi:DNA-binding CsgD family transcriptional regulator